MARIAGVDLPRTKRIETGLTYIYGIGPATATRVVQLAGVDPDRRVKDLTDDDIRKLVSVLTRECKVEGDLRREVSTNIKRLMDIGSYRGLRHRRGLPVRGQSTKSNSRTRKGKRKTVGSRKKG